MDMQVSYFVNVGKQKFKSMQVFVNCDSGYVAVLAREITRLRKSFFTELEVKGILAPELNTIVQRGCRQMVLKVISDRDAFQNDAK